MQRVQTLMFRNRLLPYACLVASCLLFCAAAEAQQRYRKVGELRIGKDILVFHADSLKLKGGAIPIVGPQDTESHDGETMAQMLGHNNPFNYMRSYGFRNGVAGIGLKDEQRYIVWDPTWGADGFQYMVLGHELGHHVCGHTIANYRLGPQAMELEADRFSGAAVRRLLEGSPYLELTVETIVRGMHKSLPKQASDSHPGIEERVAAFLKGYQEGSPCKMEGVVRF